MRLLLTFASLALAIVPLASPAITGPAIANAATTSDAIGSAGTPAYLSTKLDAKSRAKDLVSRMTVEEKAGQIQHNASAIPRLGIPAYNWWSEGLHGVARAGEATVFPQAIGMAATFDPTLVHDVADVIGTEFRAVYKKTFTPEKGSAGYRGLTVWSPNVNIFRDPRWGRGQETYGEDPYLTSMIGVGFIRGLQGDDPRYFKTIATVKHFAVHSGPENNRHHEDVHPSPRDAVETYLPAFHAAVTQGHVQGLMCAYNAIDGQPACGNTHYLQDTLRKSWGYKGHVVSDCAAVADFYLEKSHAYVKTPEAAVAAALNSGTDLICEFSGNLSSKPDVTVNAVKQGLLSEAKLDEAVEALFEARIRLGLFDPDSQVPYAAIPSTDIDTPEHRALALRTAKSAMVLLKNDGLLPLTSAPARIAVIGPNADSVDALVGNYNGTPSKPVTILAGLKARFPKAEVTYVEGTGWVAPPLEPVPDLALCIDAGCAQQGLKLETFAGGKLEGVAIETRIDPNAKVSWGRPTRQERDTSTRWSGFIVPRESGVYRFRLAGDGGYRIYVDSKLVADVWDIAWPTSDMEITLKAGQAYAVKVEAVQKGSRGDQQLQWSPPSAGDATALSAAREADLIVFAGGLTSKFEGEEMTVRAPGFAGGDRTSLDLPAPQETLLEKLQATGKPLVLVLMNGSAMSVNWADKTVPAIVEAWYPGGEGGTAVAALIAGDFSPAGRLPVTFYRSADQLPAFEDYGMTGRTYKYFTGEVLYPFGHGLSFTHFSYGPARLSRTSVKAGQSATVSVDVTNSGGRDGDEVVQLYVSRPVPGAPVRTLSGFKRIHLKARESQRVEFVIDAHAMSLVDAAGKRIVGPGSVELWIGGGQPNARPGLPPVAGVAARIAVSGQKGIAPF